MVPHGFEARSGKMSQGSWTGATTCCSCGWYTQWRLDDSPLSERAVRMANRLTYPASCGDFRHFAEPKSNQRGLAWDPTDALSQALRPVVTVQKQAIHWLD